jgi:hypothetical protein
MKRMLTASGLAARLGGAMRRNTIVATSIPVVLGVGLFRLITHGELGYSGDSVFYWSAARTLLRDGYLATGIAWAETISPGAQPQALHPPSSNS